MQRPEPFGEVAAVKHDGGEACCTHVKAARAHVQADACLDQGRRQGPVSYSRNLKFDLLQRLGQVRDGQNSGRMA